jgi:CheY-like chemotaxis protein
MEGPGMSHHPLGIRRPTILVVDDRPINRDFLVSLLKHFGYQMREAESAEQAWGMAVSGGLDLIITDVHMNGMDGFALLEKLAADPATSQIPAIVYTAAYKNTDLDRLATAKRPYMLLTKPSTPEVIVDKVQSLLGSHSEPVFSASGGPGPGESYRAAALVEVIQDLAEVRNPSLTAFADGNGFDTENKDTYADAPRAVSQSFSGSVQVS